MKSLSANCSQGLYYFLLLKFFFLSFPTFVFSQEIKQYDSLYKPQSSHLGHAKFDYYLNKKGEVIKHGKFIYKSEQKDSISQSTALVNSWNGQYKNNIKDGKWIYESQSHAVKIEGVSEASVQYTTSTNETYKSLGYKDGYPDGAFNFKANLYEDKNLVKNTETLTANLKDKKINGDFELSFLDKAHEKVTVKGNATNGLMQGFWEFYYQKDNIKERREYKEGILLTLTKIKGKDTVLNLIYPQSKTINEALTGGATDPLINSPLSLIYSDGYPRNSPYITAQLEGEKILNNALQTIFKYDTDVFKSSSLPLGTNRAFYPLNSDEKDLLKKWETTEANFRNKINTIKTLEIDNLTFVKDSTIQIIINWAIKQDSLKNYIKPWNDILLKEQIEYYNRQGLLIDYARDILENDTITTENGAHVFHYEPKVQEKPNFLSYIVLNFEDRTHVADSLITVFNRKVEELHLENEVLNVNKKIVNKSKAIDSIYKQSLGYDKLYTLITKTKEYFVKEQFEDNFNQFIAEVEVPSKIKQGEAILSSFELLNKTYQVSADIGKRAKELDSLYTDYVFDPFTYSDQVPTRLKKRLYNIITDEMTSQLIGQAHITYQEPAEVLKRVNKIYALQDRLYFLVDKNTIKLERKLRRNKSLDERLTLLNAF
ncbi:hypothetical protein [Confluentibacter citreus]|uniref:hypothetical protein n=1 Tax=Confluentibacter citreus TaxID=2007307 RepID=UPI000C282C92|nr:hypothetical protein [Confluentibacter citreus]